MLGTFSKYFKEGLLFSLFEYLLIVTPVGIYVAIEAISKGSISYFFYSPEWAIATIFLSFVGIAHYVKEIESVGKKVMHSYFGILGISNVLIVVAAVLNSSASLKMLHHSQDSEAAIMFRICLFIIVTILFFIAVAGSRTYKLKRLNK